MKYLKRIITCVIILNLILSIFACGVNNKNESQYEYKAVAETMVSASGFNTSEFNKSYILNDRKIVKTVELNTETKDFENSINWLKSYIQSFEGIIDNLYVDSGNINSTNYSKNASFTVRIKSENLDDFLNKVGDKLSITFRQENISDITDEYSDIEARLKSLKIEETSLNAMLKKAKTVEEMIKVEDKLSQVRSEIENITRRLNQYDKQVEYSTVHIYVLEVKDLANIVKNDFSKDTLVTELYKNMDDVKIFLLKILAFIFTHIPWILLYLVLAVILFVIIAIKKSISNSKNKNKNKETTIIEKETNK